MIKKFYNLFLIEVCIGVYRGRIFEIAGIKNVWVIREYCYLLYNFIFFWVLLRVWGKCFVYFKGEYVEV